MLVIGGGDFISGSVRQKLATLTFLLAWLIASGSQWDLLQVFAWSRMFVGYTQTMSVMEALTETFDAEKPCELCCLVQEAKEREQSETALQPKLPEKMLLYWHCGSAFISPDILPPVWRSGDRLVPERRLIKPAIPPPRGLVLSSFV